jgi:hypothetical protein
VGDSVKVYLVQSDSLRQLDKFSSHFIRCRRSGDAKTTDRGAVEKAEIASSRSLP